MTSPAINEFIARWQSSGAAERANNQSFLNESCGLLEVALTYPFLQSE